jgi:hypothetical protein
MAAKGKTSNAATPKKFDDTNRGVLFVNDKGDNEKRPDFTGNLAINPEDFEQGDDGLIRIRLAAWNKKSEKTGAEFLSINASPAESR